MKVILSLFLLVSIFKVSFPVEIIVQSLLFQMLSFQFSTAGPRKLCNLNCSITTIWDDVRSAASQCQEVADALIVQYKSLAETVALPYMGRYKIEMFLALSNAESKRVKKEIIVAGKKTHPPTRTECNDFARAIQRKINEVDGNMHCLISQLFVYLPIQQSPVARVANNNESRIPSAPASRFKRVEALRMEGNMAFGGGASKPEDRTLSSIENTAVGKLIRQSNCAHRDLKDDQQLVKHEKSLLMRIAELKGDMDLLFKPASGILKDELDSLKKVCIVWFSVLKI